MDGSTAQDSEPPRRTSSMAPAPCPDCGHSLIRTRRRWYERWHVRVVKRCTHCGGRFAYPHAAGTRLARERATRIALLSLVFLVLAVVGPVLVISVLPSPQSAAGPRVVMD